MEKKFGMGKMLDLFVPSTEKPDLVLQLRVDE